MSDRADRGKNDPAERNDATDRTGPAAEATGAAPRYRRDEPVRYDDEPSAPSEDGRSLPSLIRELANEASTLAREEVALAKAEMREKIGVYERNAASIGIGAALLLGALLVFVTAVNRGLTALFEAWFGLAIAVWLAPLVLAGLLAFIGYGMIKKGTAAIREEGVKPHKTIETLKEDKRWAERKVKT